MVLATKVTTAGEDRVIYIKLNGNDAFDGRSQEYAVATFDRAFALTAPLLPGANKPAVIKSDSADDWDVTIVVPDSVYIDMPLARFFTLTSTDPVLTCNFNSVVKVRSIESRAVGGTALSFTGFLSEVICSGILADDPTSIAIHHTAIGFVNSVKTKFFAVGGIGVLNDSSPLQNIPFSVDIDIALCQQPNCIMIQQDSQCDINLVLPSLLADGQSTNLLPFMFPSRVNAAVVNTTAIKVLEGTLFSSTENIESDIFATVTGNSKFCSTGCFIKGDIYVDPSGQFDGGCDVLVGDVVNEGTMHITAGNYTGTVTETAQINGELGGVRYGNDIVINTLETLLAAESLAVSQQPGAVNTPITIEFGVAQGTISDPVMIDALGNITINVTGDYLISIRAVFGRTGTGGVAQLRARVLVDGVPSNISTGAAVVASTTAIPIASLAPLNLVEGQVLKVEFMRDSIGMNDGGLFQLPSSLVGWGDVPSALLVIQRIVVDDEP